MKVKIVKNTDKELVAHIEELLRQNDNYCPCQIQKTKDTKCMCKDFREQKTAGFCHCTLFEKIEINETEVE